MQSSDPSVRRALALGTAAVQEAMVQAEKDKADAVAAAVGAERARFEAVLKAEREKHARAQHELGTQLAARFEAAAAAEQSAMLERCTSAAKAERDKAVEQAKQASARETEALVARLRKEAEAETHAALQRAVGRCSAESEALLTRTLRDREVEQSQTLQLSLEAAVAQAVGQSEARATHALHSAGVAAEAARAEEAAAYEARENELIERCDALRQQVARMEEDARGLRDQIDASCTREAQVTAQVEEQVAHVQLEGRKDAEELTHFRVAAAVRATVKECEMTTAKLLKEVWAFAKSNQPNTEPYTPSPISIISIIPSPPACPRHLRARHVSPLLKMTPLRISPHLPVSPRISPYLSPVSPLLILTPCGRCVTNAMRGSGVPSMQPSPSKSLDFGRSIPAGCVWCMPHHIRLHHTCHRPHRHRPHRHRK